MHLLYALVTGVAAAYCLLAIWVAIGRGHWFARACVLLAALALLVPIRAYEPLILFGMAAVLLVGMWSAGRMCYALWRQDSATDATRASLLFRFRLIDVLLACAVAGAASWMISVLVARELFLSWWRFGLAALVLAALASVAALVVRGRRRWITIPITLLAIAGAVKVDHLVLKNYLYTDELLEIVRDGAFAPREGVDQLAALYSLFAGWSLVLTAAAAAWSYAYQSARHRHVVRTLIVVAAAPCVLLAGCVFWHMLGVPTPPVADSDENHLPRILDLSKRLSAASPDEAEAIYSELLQLLKRPAAVSIDWTSLGRNPEAELEIELADIQIMRGVARQMDAECQRLLAAGRPDEAGDFALATIRYGNSNRRGGLVIQFLVGEAIAGIGHSCLARCRTGLSRAQALEGARLLESISANDEPPESLLARDTMWTDRSFTWRHRLGQAMQFEIWGQTPTTGMEKMLPMVIDRVGCQSDLLLVDLALRAYVADHGSLPANLDDLVPQYLDRIPADRYSGRPLVYRRAEEGFVLYSAGKDGRDDGGKFGNNTTYFASPGYDYDVDTMIRP